MEHTRYESLRHWSELVRLGEFPDYCHFQQLPGALAKPPPAAYVIVQGLDIRRDKRQGLSSALPLATVPPWLILGWVTYSLLAGGCSQRCLCICFVTPSAELQRHRCSCGWCWAWKCAWSPKHHRIRLLQEAGDVLTSHCGPRQSAPSIPTISKGDKSFKNQTPQTSRSAADNEGDHPSSERTEIWRH